LIRVTLIEKTLNILIKNTGILAPSGQITGKEFAGTKTGIYNIKKRLSLFYPDCSTFELFEKDHYVHALITIKHPGIAA
jgi:LytS/YehU family sensor histidine kinase